MLLHALHMIETEMPSKTKWLAKRNIKNLKDMDPMTSDSETESDIADQVSTSPSVTTTDRRVIVSDLPELKFAPSRPWYNFEYTFDSDPNSSYKTWFVRNYSSVLRQEPIMTLRNYPHEVSPVVLFNRGNSDIHLNAVDFSEHQKLFETTDKQNSVRKIEADISRLKDCLVEQRYFNSSIYKRITPPNFFRSCKEGVRRPPNFQLLKRTDVARLLAQLQRKKFTWLNYITKETSRMSNIPQFPQLRSTLHREIRKLYRLRPKCDKAMETIRMQLRRSMAKIDDSPFVIADITYLNLNVVYEIGFAIGRNKRTRREQNADAHGHQRTT